MHELGIATGVLDSVVKVAKQNNCISVKKINVVVGKRAGIIEQMFAEAFNALKELDEYELCKNAKIVSRPCEGKDVFVENIEVEQDD